MWVHSFRRRSGLSLLSVVGIFLPKLLQDVLLSTDLLLPKAVSELGCGRVSCSRVGTRPLSVDHHYALCYPSSCHNSPLATGNTSSLIHSYFDLTAVLPFTFCGGQHFPVKLVCGPRDGAESPPSLIWKANSHTPLFPVQPGTLNQKQKLAGGQQQCPFCL